MAIKREQVIRTAEKYVAKGRLEAAIKEYRKVLAENPNDANTLNRVGDLYARTERFDEAVKLFSQIADQYTRDGFHVKAIAIYKKIIKLDPTSLQVYERLAELYHKQGLLNEARGQYQVLADYYEKHDNAASAISIYQRMSEIEPENPAFHLKLAGLYQAQQLADKALREYRQLADLLLVNGSVDEATQVYLKALDISSEDLDFIREAVSGLHDGGHVGAAVQVLTKATELNPEAEAIARQVGMGGREAEGPEAAGPAAPPAVQEPEIEDEVSFDVEEDLEVPEVEAAEAPELEIGEEELAEAFVAKIKRVQEPADVAVFTLDLDDDEMPSTQVVPPPDMLEDAAAEAEDVEFDLSIEGFEAPGVPDPDFVSAAAAADEAVAAGGSMAGEELAEEEGVEIDWMGDIEGIDFASDSETPVPAAAAGVEEVEFSAFEIDLDEDAEAVEPEPVPAEAQAPEPLAELQPIGPKALRHEDDLLAEAKVFAKYGLHEKAQDRLNELLGIRPQHLEGLQLLAKIDLDTGRREQAMERANEISRLAVETGNLEPWHELRDELVKAGFELEDDLVTSEPTEKVGEDDRIAQLLDDLSLDSLDEVPRAADTGKLPVVPPAAAGPPLPVTQPPRSATPAAAAAPAPAVPEKQLISLADELGLDELDELDDMEEVAIPAAQEAAPPPAPANGDLDETGMSWLDEVAADDMAVTRHNEAIFDEEADFFDLASELERELKDEEPAKQLESEEQPQEQSLQDIIDGFKQGVAENLSIGDCDTHFNLGIAYREMGLLDEAIGEFQLAAKDPSYMVECSSMLGICFLDKGLPELAIKWYRKGLETPSINEDQTLGLLYDMGAAYINVGDAEKAYKTFVEIYGINSNYRDVAAKLYELSQTP